MKCRPAPREGSFKKKAKKSAPRGVWGEQLSFPQVESPKTEPPPLRLVPPPVLPPPQPIQPQSAFSSGIDAEQDELIQRIQVQVRSLNWTLEEISEFIASRFDGKRRYQLNHDELLLLLYHLRNS